MPDQTHPPQSGDRNVNAVARRDKPLQDKLARDQKKGEKKMDDASKRDQGVR
ncbi:hypothetical protein [Luteibacter sahnii]|uniref:hypothetical protein n=1 Tax=Luteibacter sahnii TaxID=3021977 RepID=UPI002A6B2663|nr:hypothetical protein [Luteibacter sp. PPL193]MDY1549549.1 hypothetical protein [Luteibacter sp. PPL193]